MKKVQVKKLSGVALDYFVGKCVGFSVKIPAYADKVTWLLYVDRNGTDHHLPTWHKSWNDAGPIIDEQGIELVLQDEGSDIWWAKGGRVPPIENKLYRSAGSYGDTPIEAAMRFYVMSVLGEEVEIPEGL